jgi:hypothetical protein
MAESVAFSARASLVALGVRFQQLGIWSVVQTQVKIKQKIRKHTPLDKLLDFVVSSVERLFHQHFGGGWWLGRSQHPRASGPRVATRL